MRIEAFVYDPTTAGMVLGRGRVGVGILGDGHVANPFRLGYDQLGTGTLGGTGVARLWLAIDPDRLAYVEADYGLKTRGTPPRPDVGTLTATWHDGGGDPDMHPGTYYGTPVRIMSDGDAVLWAGRVTDVNTNQTDDDIRITWTAADYVADLAGIEWAPGQLGAIWGATAPFSDRASHIAAGPTWWTAATGAIEQDWGGPYQTIPVGSNPDKTTSVDLMDQAAAAVGALWWAAHRVFLVNPDQVQVGAITYAHTLHQQAPIATFSDISEPSYVAITVGLQTSEVTNRLTLKSAITGARQTVSDPTSVATLGPRASSYEHLAANDADAVASSRVYLNRTRPSYTARSITITKLPDWWGWSGGVWAPIDVVRKGRRTKARIAHVQFRITPDRKAPGGAKWRITFRLIERP